MDFFGKTGVDVVTGFSGVAIGFCTYTTGCSQILLAPKVNKDGGFREAHWFDQQRIKFTNAKKLIINNGNNSGPDLAAPLK